MKASRRQFIQCAAGAVVLANISVADETSPFSTQDDGKRLTILEDGKPVYVYNYTTVEPPGEVNPRFARMNYLHPVYAADGTVVTEDFPADHYHHRGVFWAWPNCQVKGRKLNVWELDGAHPVFEKWLRQEMTADSASVQSQSVWRFDDDGFAPIQEQALVVARRVAQGIRTLEFELTFRNVSEQKVLFQGSSASAGTAGTGAKGYGGFCYRPDARDKPFTFTAEEGVVPEDRMACETSWVDISWGGDSGHGVTIVQHPKNPGYPHRGWIIRHYGFLGASWPHTETHALEPGELFALRYSLRIHSGNKPAVGQAER